MKGKRIVVCGTSVDFQDFVDGLSKSVIEEMFLGVKMLEKERRGDSQVDYWITATKLHFGLVKRSDGVRFDGDTLLLQKHKYSFREIGKLMCVSRQRISQMVNLCLNRIEKYFGGK